MSSLNYLIVLGRQPEFGLIELESLLGAAAVQPFGRQTALVGQELAIDRLGGAVKMARVLYRGPKVPLERLPIDVPTLPVGETKTSFGLSFYGLRATPRQLLAVGLSLKKRLRERGSVRLVVPARGVALSAAELRHNRVVEEGFELLVAVERGEMIVALTLGVQNIDWYSRRDYGRPARSAKVGMLPPKLAQIMVNTTSAAVVVDPFCGTGVVLAEALLLGRRVVGSDLAPAMVEASQQNLQWLGREVPDIMLPTWRVVLADARHVELPSDVSVAVVSEGYLGPNFTHSPAPAELERAKAELLELYRQSLANFARQLPSGGEVALTVPAWRVGRGWDYLGVVDELAKLGYTLKGFKHVRTPLLYAREDQVVGRQLLLLRKN